jgi:hypothetical protein
MILITLAWLIAGEHTAPAGLLGTFAGALLSGCREAARAVKLLRSSGPTSLEVCVHPWFEEGCVQILIRLLTLTH